MSGTSNQQSQGLISTLLAGIQVLGNINKVLNNVAISSGQKYLVANLPAVTAADQGLVAYALNGRNTGELAGAGTGCLVTVNSAGVWAAVWSGVLVTA